VSGRQTIYIQLIHGGIAFVVIVAATVLAALHDLDPATVVALFGAAVGFAGGTSVATGALAQAVNGKAVMTEHAISEREATLTRSINALANSSPTPPGGNPIIPQPPERTG
jgi:hypothetical protein